MLKILKPGFYTTIQDSGRFGFRNKGVPVSGCMDNMAFEQCNRLLENEKNTPVLEITMTGPTLEFLEPTFITLTGANMNPKLNNDSISNYSVIRVKKGDVLSFEKLASGFRCYLGVKGGFETEMVLDSASQFMPLTPKAQLTKNDEVAYKSHSDFNPLISGMKPANYLSETNLQVFQGPEFHLLSESQIDKLFASEFHISKENNRMAYQLEEAFESHSHNILTSATLPGTVQCTPAGKLIILMRDGQTTGGYPRLLQLRNDAISALAQKKMGDKIKFELFYN
ncbi:biotin-dependent carboxyltransferase family protein [Croceivirga thetidis]|uniref:Biotin-dependent carboxyltransferase family protein n=1 Tax=Croceivirga thetidis TaxID=2721623 RepID=A0ABX1GRB1_9FLAO|nr:biotin-dependent carboxyltransferase family protein [Croceivirga thetidis]NKI32454.1 biotin-dependent carboxyltransferase family protein [Croceivirga thetidis]